MVDEQQRARERESEARRTTNTKRCLEKCSRLQERRLLRQSQEAFKGWAVGVRMMAVRQVLVCKAIARMRRRGLESAFDCYAGAVGAIVEEREAQQQQLCREEQQAVDNESRLAAVRESVLARQLALRQRIFRGLLLRQLSQAWQLFTAACLSAQCQRNHLRRAVSRIHHFKLWAAFDVLCGQMSAEQAAETKCSRLTHRLRHALACRVCLRWQDWARAAREEKRMVRKCVRRCLAQSLAAWCEELEAAKQCRNDTLLGVSDRWVRQTLLEALLTWSAEVFKTRALLKIRKHVRQAGLTAAFAALSQSAGQARSLRRVAGKVAIRWNKSATAAAFVSWGLAASELQRLQRAVGKVINRWKHTAMVAAFVSWASRAAEDRALRRVADKVLVRWSLLTLGSPFRSWQGRAAASKRLALQRAAVLRKGCLCTALRGWFETASEHRRLARLLERLAGVQMVQVARCVWWEWREQVRKARVAKRAGVRWRARCALHTFARWIDLVQGRPQMTQAAERLLATFIKRGKTRAISAAFQPWRSKTVRNAVLGVIRAKVVRRQERMFALVALQSWAGQVRATHV